MHCIELPVANFKIETTTFTWTWMAKRMLVSCLCKSDARVLHKYSKVETFIRIRSLNSLALKLPNKFWSKNPGLCNPRSWAHKRRWCLPLRSLKSWSASVNKHAPNVTTKPSHNHYIYIPQCYKRRAVRVAKLRAYGYWGPFSQEIN